MMRVFLQILLSPLELLAGLVLWLGILEADKLEEPYRRGVTVTQVPSRMDRERIDRNIRDPPVRFGLSDLLRVVGAFNRSAGFAFPLMSGFLFRCLKRVWR